jgi:NADPH-dependent F420 reductase
MPQPDPSVAIVGATGALGGALARRLAKAGHRVIVGSRDLERARATAAVLASTTRGKVTAASNIEAARAADIVVVAVPSAAQRATLTEIAPVVRGKIVVDTTVPLMPPRVMRVQLPAEGSAAAIAQAVLGPEVKVVAAFHNVAAHKLATDEPVACDVLVFGNDRTARAAVVRLVEACGLRGLHGGALVNSAAAEALTSVLIFLNKTYGVDGAGIQVTGRLVPPEDG